MPAKGPPRTESPYRSTNDSVAGAVVARNLRVRAPSTARRTGAGTSAEGRIRRPSLVTDLAVDSALVHDHAAGGAGGVWVVALRLRHRAGAVRLRAGQAERVARAEPHGEVGPLAVDLQPGAALRPRLEHDE